jgi:hypothetical protein
VTQVALLFSDGGGERTWWERWLAPATAHVDILVLTEAHAVLMESFGGHLTVTDMEGFTAWRLIARWPGTVVVFTPASRRRQRCPFGMSTCVTLAKAVLGCNDWRGQTPAALRQWALARGGIEYGRESTEDHAGPARARTAPDQDAA